MPADPKLLTAIIAAISVLLSAGISTFVTLFLAFRAGKRDREKSLIDYLKTKIEKLETAKEQLVNHHFSKPDMSEGVASAMAAAVENSYQLGQRILMTYGHYLDDNVTFKLEQKRDLITNSIGYRKAIAQDIVKADNWEGETDHFLAGDDIIAAMPDFLESVRRQINAELRDAVADIERLGGI